MFFSKFIASSRVFFLFLMLCGYTTISYCHISNGNGIDIFDDSYESAIKQSPSFFYFCTSGNKEDDDSKPEKKKRDKKNNQLKEKDGYSDDQGNDDPGGNGWSVCNSNVEWEKSLERKIRALNRALLLKLDVDRCKLLGDEKFSTQLLKKKKNKLITLDGVEAMKDFCYEGFSAVSSEGYSVKNPIAFLLWLKQHSGHVNWAALHRWGILVKSEGKKQIETVICDKNPDIIVKKFFSMAGYVVDEGDLRNIVSYYPNIIMKFDFQQVCRLADEHGFIREFSLLPAAGKSRSVVSDHKDEEVECAQTDSPPPDFALGSTQNSQSWLLARGSEEPENLSITSNWAEDIEAVVNRFTLRQTMNDLAGELEIEQGIRCKREVKKSANMLDNRHFKSEIVRTEDADPVSMGEDPEEYSMFPKQNERDVGTGTGQNISDNEESQKEGDKLFGNVHAQRYEGKRDIDIDSVSIRGDVGRFSMFQLDSLIENENRKEFKPIGPGIKSGLETQLQDASNNPGSNKLGIGVVSLLPKQTSADHEAYSDSGSNSEFWDWKDDSNSPQQEPDVLLNDGEEAGVGITRISSYINIYQGVSEQSPTFSDSFFYQGQ
ncbi:hypothetical protein CI610_00838 [invertebrate metagenome]|uniref:Uncharacterized protein n=1 Tax=invertebrate metagenome TaxID=1711999 RepID=A0A2H9TAB6_9ZZZZ